MIQFNKDFLKKAEDFYQANKSILENLQGFSPKEKSVIIFLALGFSAGQIAKTMNIKVSTVDSYRQRAYVKLAIKRRSELVIFCLNIWFEGIRKNWDGRHEALSKYNRIRLKIGELEKALEIDS